MEAPHPADEATRLETLAACGILDSEEEDAFDALARLAAEVCEAPMALVSLIDKDRRWFKARVAVEAKQTPRSLAFCAHAILSDDPLVVPDTRSDPRFADNPVVQTDPAIRFYAGVPLKIDRGSAVGTLCVMDRRPRELMSGQLEALRAIARLIQRELRTRREASTGGRGGPKPEWIDLPVADGDVIGRWRVVRTLGRGGTGAVFEARAADGLRAAIKILLPMWLSHENVVERFVREARVLRTLHGPHIARILDVGNLEENRGWAPYLVLEYLEGTDLSNELRKHGRVDWRRAAGWMIDVCDAIDEAHHAGIIHRDLKPANVFLAGAPEGQSAGEGPRQTTEPVIKVIDFGIAKTEEAPAVAPLTDPRGVIGSPCYMAPEQMRTPNEVDARCDLWAVGVMLHKLVSGEVPFRGTSGIELCVAVLNQAPVLLRDAAPDAPAWLEAVISRCLEKSREARYADAGQLRRALEDGLRNGGHPASAA